MLAFPAIRVAYAGNAFLAYARKVFTGLQLYRCHPTKLSPGWSQNSRVLIRTLDGVFNPIPNVLSGLANPDRHRFFCHQNSRVLIRTLDGVFNPIPNVLIGTCKSRPASLFLPSKLVSFDSTLFAMPMPETLSLLTLEKSSPAYNYYDYYNY